jgi:hypothetical protein
MQWFEKSIFNSDIQRPSSDQLWQIPALWLLPKPFEVFFRLLPLEEHDTSNFAAADKISSLVSSSISSPFRHKWLLQIKHFKH